MNQTFTESAIDRLRKFLIKNNQPDKIDLLTPDASTREYFRISWQEKSAIACIYPEPFTSQEHSYLDVTNLFFISDLPVAEIYDFDGELGVIVQEDFGDTILRDVLLTADTEQKEDLINKAISLIARIQAATPKAFELNSIASKLKFDTEKLLWELNFFKTHYFETFRKEKLSQADDAALTAEFTELSAELETRAAVLCHRDFHAANIMIDAGNHLRIIDHQDARIGSVAYDPVSLLLDRVLEPPPADWLKAKKLYFLEERDKFNLGKIEFADFDYEFQLMTVQRCLKATGTFSFQSVNRGKAYFVQYINPMLRIVLQACQNLDRFKHLQSIIKKQI